jgi:mannosyltransferase OCH1-like enzyme
MIPKKIHHMHRTGDWSKDVKGHVTERCLKSFEELNPDYEIVLWTNDMLFKFMKDEWPEYYDQWIKNNKGGIGHLKPWDTARLCVLYKYGGFYMDNDISCMKPLDDLLDNSFVGRRPLYRWDLRGHYSRKIFWSDEATAETFNNKELDLYNFDKTPPHSCNAFFACAPNDPTVKQLIDEIIKRSSMPEQAVCTATGCVLWGQVLERKIKENDLEGVRFFEHYEFAEGAEKLGWIEPEKFEQLYALHKAWEWKKVAARWKCFPSERTKEQAESLDPEKGII